MESRMKILIVGNKGQLGSELTECFARKKTELGTPALLLEENDVCGVDFDELDISDSAAVKEYFRNKSFDCVINCAAYTDVNGCESHPDVALKANALGPRNLAFACEETGAKLLHVSTDYVFSGEGTVPYTEFDRCDPKSVYGKSKLLGEEYVRQICPRSFIVRTAWLYGYYGKNFVKTIVRAARERGELSVVNDQRGNPTNAADLAHHIIKLCESEEYGIYHATGAGECSWFDFASEIVAQFGVSAAVRPCTTEEYPTPAKRPAYSSLRNLMLECTVGDEFRDWKTALAAFAEHCRRQAII